VVGVREAIDALCKAADQGEGAVVVRVVQIEGFSTRPGDAIVAIDSNGEIHGSLLAGLASQDLQDVAASMLASGAAEPRTVTIDVREKDAVAAGLACGGRAHLLLHPASAIPPELWRLLASRAPAALITRRGSAVALVVDRDGRVHGEPDRGADWPVREALGLLEAARSETRTVEGEQGQVLVESWVPDPRIVVVGTGELIEAIAAQASLLGWETRATSGVPDELGGLLEWSGAAGALVVLSHDPRIDTPALAEGLRSGVAYVGALGSRATQSKRTERLLADGVAQSEIDRIHRPIGLDLGGRRAPEVALAIVAEILANHCGRDARPLSTRTGAIH
jgi:xanthine dehydrogenase accessory factor